MKKLAIILPMVLLAVSVQTTIADYGVQTNTSGCTANQALPDSACTPGAVLTTDTSIICKSGYTKTVKNVPLAESKQVFTEYGIPYNQHSKYEVDHLISLEIGGSNGISNLWPEKISMTYGSLTKDKFENYLHAQVCSGKMTITEAQTEISNRWLQNYQASLTTNAAGSAKIAPGSAHSTPSANKPKPSASTASSAPVGATGKCVDGSYTYATNHRGACSHHGGVAQWY
jgi:hypothetical protein